MKIKIKEILEKRQPYHPPGKNYTAYSFRVNAITEEKILLSNIQISTLSQKIAENLKPDEIFEVLEKQIQTQNGIMTVYNIQAPKEKYSNPIAKKIPFGKYKQLVNNCYLVAKALDMEKAEILFDKILGCASIMVDAETIPEEEINRKIDEAIDNLEKNTDPYMQQGVSDDDIPF